MKKSAYEMYLKMAGLIVLLFVGSAVQAANQYWDSATNSGFQHGNGSWSTGASDTNWSGSTGTNQPATWTNASTAIFGATGGSSLVTLNNTAIQAAGIAIGGSAYTLILTNGGRISNATVAITMSGGTNRVEVSGGVSASYISNTMALNIGLTNGYNEFWINGGGTPGGAFVTNTGAVIVGSGSGSRMNHLVVTNGGYLYGTAASSVGASSSASNCVEVTGGGSVWNNGAQTLTIGVVTGANANSLIIDGQGVVGGARVTNVSTLYVGVDAFWVERNSVLVTNGGILSLGSGTHIIGGHTASAVYYSTSNRLDIVQGGRVNSLGPIYVGKTAAAYQGSHWDNKLVVRDSASLLDLGGFALVLGFFNGGGANFNVSGNELIVDGGVATNVGAITISSGAGGGGSTSVYKNGLVVTNGGRLYSRGPVTVGQISNSWAIVTGTESLWDVGGSNLTIGGTAAYASSNWMTINQGATVRNGGTLTVYATNTLELRGGTLTFTNITSTMLNRFDAGDGTQSATLGVLGGTFSFPWGLSISSNATLTGWGIVTGGVTGVVLTNGAAIAPGLAGVGALAVRGSNLTWNGGATYRCDITNIFAGPGVGWDVINVSSQLVMATGAELCRISVESQGQTTYGFLSGSDYNFLIMTLGNAADFDPAKVTIRTNDFASPANGNWGVTNIGTNVYLTYRTAAAADAVYTWDAPSNGNWTVGMNWTNRVTPISYSPSMILQFGVGGSTARYTATNNIAGWFALNRLVLTNANAAATNALMGNGLEFWNAGARVEQGGASPCIISNALNLRADLELAGAGSGAVTLAGAISGTGTLTKTGSSTVILPISNNFAGAVTVNGASGVLRMDNVNALGTNSFTVSGGTLWANVNSTLGVGSPYRTAQVTGSGSVWTNSLGLTLGTNGLITVASGARLACGLLTVAHAGAPNTGLIVTNGGQLFSRGATVIGTTTSNNTVLVTGANSLWNHANSNLTIGTGSFTNSQLRIDQAGSVLNIGTLTVIPSNDVVLRGGSLTASNLMSTKGSVWTVGDGVQPVALGILSGSWTNTAGILIQSNVTVSGRGQMTGGNGGLIFTNGSSLIPGVPGSETNTMGTLLLGNSTWYGGMTLELNVTNVAGTNGSGWDVVRVVGNLNLIPNGGKLKIKLNSLGETVGGFHVNTARVVNLVDFTTASIDPADIEVDTNKFLIGSDWFLEVTPTDIRYSYRRAVSGIYVATNGNNSAGTNWVTAFTTLSNAMTSVQNYDTVYVAGQTFSITSQVALSGRVGVSILGGYQAAPGGALPGANNPAIWPTIVQRTGGVTRVLYLSGLTNSLIQDLTLQNGLINTVAGYGVGMWVGNSPGVTLASCTITNNKADFNASAGGGIYAINSSIVLTNCLIVNNQSYAGSGNTTAYGGGIHQASGNMTMILCRVTGNATANGGAGGAGSTYAGGLCVAGTAYISHSIFRGNIAQGYGKFAGGGGIYNVGTLTLVNSLVDHNVSSDQSGNGIYSSGNLKIRSGTVADNNPGVGIFFAGGTVSLTNSIVWGHTDDLKGFPNDGQVPSTLSNVAFSCIGNGDNNGKLGCVSIDPQFADTNYYHLRSIQQYYTSGYFSGGSWTTAISNSPVIDMGDPVSDYSLEPAPNGSRINLGAYGNTPVASKTDITTVFTPPVVTNLGATVWGHRTVRINGQVTATGGQTPSVWLYYWITGNASTSTAWVGLQDRLFVLDLNSLTPGNSYEFYLTASNASGISTSLVQTFAMQPSPSSLYVSTNGNNTAGTNWSSAYTNLQEALNIIEDGDTIYLAGHTFSRSPGYQQPSLWTWSGDSGVAVIGGYQATSDVGLPGANDPLQWPTILTRAGGSARILYLSGLTNTIFQNIRITGGYSSGTTDNIGLYSGIGMYVTKCTGLTFDRCQLVNSSVGAPGTWSGGGAYLDSSIITFTNCVISTNSINGSNNSTTPSGGGIFLTAGTATLVRCVLAANSASGNYGSGGTGGGIYVNSTATAIFRQSVIARNAALQVTAAGGGIYNLGKLFLENCVIDHNNSGADNGDGIYAAGGSAWIMNATVADNPGIGIQWAGGVVAVTNSILWGHSDDLKSLPNNGGTLSNVAYCIIKDGDNNGLDGCISLDPLFVDTNYYHVQSQQGQYTNGYFSGGGWQVGLSNSPAIDNGDPSSDYTNEPAPRGDAINLGAYGNTEVASKTFSVVANPAAVTNYGATIWGHRTVRLSGEVLDTGGEIPEAGFLYWIVGHSVTSQVSEGLKTAGFISDVTGLTPGSNYQFVAYASNSAGLVLSDVKSFSTHPTPSSLYVSTNGNNTAGTSWSTAYTNLQDALNIIESNDMVYLAGHTFARAPGFQQSSLWTWSGDHGVTVIGGYQAASDVGLPGANDPAQWPTVLTRASGSARILYVSGLTNVTIRNLLLFNGYSVGTTDGILLDRGMGLYASKCTFLTLERCNIVSNKVTNPGTYYGAGAFLDTSVMVFTNCSIASNSLVCANNANTFGGGLFLNSGTTTLVRCSVVANAASGNYGGYAGGISVEGSARAILTQSVVSRNTMSQNDQGGGIRNAGQLSLENCVLDHNNSSANSGDGIYAVGGTTLILSSTLADNSGVGLYRAGGTVTITNSILWNNGIDLTGTVSVAYCDIQTANSFWTNGVNGCISVDPLFVDTTYYHLQSRAGHFTGGYFSGGSWGASLDNDSPCIDAGDPTSPFSLEPPANGRRVNLGAYGNTEVASKTVTASGSFFIFY